MQRSNFDTVKVLFEVQDLADNLTHDVWMSSDKNAPCSCDCSEYDENLMKMHHSRKVQMCRHIKSVMDQSDYRNVMSAIVDLELTIKSAKSIPAIFYKIENKVIKIADE